jgi:hypothetical protein
MALQSVIELILAVAAMMLLGRDLLRAWRDQARRPMSLLVAALVAALFIGTLASGAHPNPWWLVLPVVVLAWEVARGWRLAPRCHLWEAGVGAFTASLLLAVAGLGLDGGSLAAALLATAAVAGVLGLGLVWQSRQREPRPWRVDDPNHYERRRTQRNRG